MSRDGAVATPPPAMDEPSGDLIDDTAPAPTNVRWTTDFREAFDEVSSDQYRHSIIIAA